MSVGGAGVGVLDRKDERLFEVARVGDSSVVGLLFVEEERLWLPVGWCC